MNLTIIQKSIDYIEDNLKTDIAAKELSEMAGFYKAFIREFGYTPTEFLNMSKKRKPYRINLCKENHIMVSHKKIKEVLKNWGLENEKLTDVVYDETGNVSESSCYVGDKYIIKFSPNLGSVEKHISLSQAIESVGLSTATPIKTIEGKFVAASEDLYFYVTKRLEGKQLKASKMYFEDYMQKARFIGEIVGQLSVALAKVDVVANQADIFKSAKEWAIPTLVGKMELPEDFVEMYEKEFGEIYESLPQQMIHRDPNPGNIILCGDKWGILDFDLSERNIRIFDPCYAATAILSESFDIGNTDKLRQWIEIYKNILYGYDEVVKLLDNEWKAVPYVVITNQLIATAWFSEQEKYRELYEINKKMTEWMIQNFDNMLFES